MTASCASFQKHLGIYLDEKFIFNQHVKEKITKAMKGIGVILFSPHTNHFYGFMLNMVIFYGIHSMQG